MLFSLARDVHYARADGESTARFAVKAGAKHVYAVDISSMIETAREIAKVNGMADQITFIRGRVEETELPKVDVIVSEWMGFCLLSEMNLDCVLDARDRCLSPNGLIWPDKTSLHIAAIDDAEKRKAKVDCMWIMDEMHSCWRSC